MICYHGNLESICPVCKRTDVWILDHESWDISLIKPSRRDRDYSNIYEEMKKMIDDMKLKLIIPKIYWDSAGDKDER